MTLKIQDMKRSILERNVCIEALQDRLRRARQAALQIGRAKTAVGREKAYSKLLHELNEVDGDV